MICEHVYLRNGLVIIVDAYENTKSSARGCGYNDDYNSSCDPDDEMFDEMEPDLVTHACPIPVALLRTCRQIYAEASGIL
jgi:hypothetical protein